MLERSEIQRLLNDGISAVRRGDLERGRELLLQVVEADDHLEPAWIWLSQAVDDPADKLVALENALVLNPANAQAQAQAQFLRKQLGIEPEPTPKPQIPNPNHQPPAANHQPPALSYDLDDDPYQCAYCGKLTRDTDGACPHCGRNLLVAGAWKGGGFEYVTLIVGGLDTQAALFEVFLIYAASSPPAITLGIQFFAHNFPPVAIARLFLLAGLMLMFLSDLPGAYLVTLVVTVMDLIWSGVGYWLGYLHPLIAALNAALGAGLLLISVVALASRSQARARLRVEIDRQARSAVELYRRGHAYRREGQWALAALHWRKAVALKSTEPQFYKDLGIAQAQLGRYAKALDALEEGASRAPEDEEFKTLIEAVKAKIK